MIVVVGAGLAGLRVASGLVSDGHDVRIFEARKGPGGRVRTVEEGEDGAGEGIYESGPWRVPVSHARVRRLLHEKGVRTLPMETPTPKYGRPPRPIAGLSIWDVTAFRTRCPSSADAADLDTSYADETRAASGSAPYAAASGESFLYAPEGLSRLPVRMAEGLGVEYDRRVVDVVRRAAGYRVTVSHRVEGNVFETFVVDCTALFACVPPSAFRQWTIFLQHGRSLANAVEEGPLHHIYASDPRFPRGRHTLHPNSLLAQVVSAQGKSSFFQASYSGGRLATFWNHLKLRSPETFLRLLRDELKHAVGFRLSPNADVRSHHWPVAYHAWKPVPGFDVARAVRTSVEPSRRLLPGVYVAGEAFSSHQAWMEGALETAEAALYRFRHRRPPRPLRADDTTVDGCVVDVAAWANVHPGGAGAIRNYVGQDLTDLLSHVGHSSHAWAVAHSLKTGE